MAKCQHLNQHIDDYGVSCQSCGEQLAGYNYENYFVKGDGKCIHVWDTPEFGQKECIYCTIIEDS